MDNNDFDNIKSEVDKLAKIINSPESLLPIYGFSIDERPCVSLISDGHYCLTYSDRGEIKSSYIASDIDHLLYLIFSGLTYSIALFHTKYKKGVVPIKLIYQRQLELLGEINKDWQEKEKLKIGDRIH